VQRGGRRLALAAGLVALAVAGVLVLRHLRGGLGPEMDVVELVDDLTALERATVDAPPGTVHVASIEPSRGFQGGFRRALVTPPPATLRFRVHVPEDGTLRYAVAVARSGRRNTAASGVRFAVRVDGTDIQARDVNPAATRHDRHWFEERVSLARWAGRDVELALATAPAGDGPVDGTPGWANVRLMRETRVARQAATPDRPNVLVVVVDTLRADRLGCYGAMPSPSPVLDALARSGLVFAQSVSQSSWTMPSVATLLTGLHPRSHGVVGGSCLWGNGRREGGAEADEPACAYLADAVPTLAELAQRAGITTFGVSANPLVARSTNYARGFETFVEFTPDSQWHELADAEAVNRAFLDWLRPNRRWRFLAYLQYVDPHHPYTPPDGFRPPPPAGLRDAVSRGRVDAIAHRINREGGPLFSADEVAYLRALYDAEIAYWDHRFGALRRALQELGVADSTVVVVTADHGETFQEHGGFFHGTQLYDEQVRVPLVVAGPGIPPGRLLLQAQGIDVLPTVATLLGIAVPPGLPGRDLLHADGTVRPAMIETRHAVGSEGESVELLAVRTPAWKLIQVPSQQRTELYDLAADPGEHRDVAAARAAERDDLRARLAAWEAAAPPPPVARSAGREGLHRRLRALGYVQ
jgi:arylsulfatase A-like enzyme